MSDARRLRLEVVLAAVDKATRPLRNLMNANNDLARAVKATRAQLKDLERTQAGIDSFRKLSRDAAITGNQLKAVRGRADELARQLKETREPSAALTKAFEAAKREAQALKVRQSELAEKLHQVRGRLADAGIGTQNLAQHQRALRSRIASTNEQLEAQTQRMAAVTAQQRRMATAQQAADKVRARAGTVAAAGAGATAAGMAAGAPLLKGLGEAKHYDLERVRIGALGLGDESTKEALAFAEKMKAYGVSQVEKAELMRDAMSVFADTHHAELVMPTLAKMKFANAAVFGQADGAENERKFVDMLKVIELRGGLASEGEFKKQADMVQKVITATGGRVQADEWLNVIKTGGLAAKGADDKAFYYTLEPLVQEMGGNRVGTAMMSAYQNLYQGKTTKRALHNLDNFGLIADRSKVKEDKAGQVSFMDPGALKGADLFRQNQFAWLEKVLLPTLAAKGITDRKQVEDAIGSIFSNRTAAGLFAQMYLQRQQIHKNMRLNEGAAGIDQLEARAKGTAQGQELDTLAKVHDLEKALGEKVLPLYARALELVGKAAEGVTSFMENHPTLAKAAAIAVGALAASLLVLGPIMLAVASVLGPYAMLHILCARLGVTGGVLSGVLRGLAGAFSVVMRAVAVLGRVLLMNPIGLLVTAIAVAAYLIYRYWEPISEFFSGLWQQVKTAFDGGIAGVSALILNWSPAGLFYAALAPVLQWFGFDVPAKFTEFGANIVQGLANGIRSAIGWVTDAVGSVASGAIAAFKSLLGIHSPSRVFAELGGFTMAGLGEGLTRGQEGPLQAVQRVAARMTGIGAGIAIGAAPAVASPVRFDTRPPLVASSGAGTAAPAATAPITIVINPPAGSDERLIARLVEDRLRQIENQRAARGRSRLTDTD
ncbi:phage tail protein [Ralstonia pseudosolanacearum]|uniref:phage tail tape measure protein n=1 Tax=Ralstonia pseudosolanacearum TaxID=1310165 RepID=UPI00035B0294|nr:phage-related tail protein [Ralstonia pseudosolanacearum]AXV94457.1 phage tail protein [Ralstonia solanacearum]ESS50189.1 phage-related tail transmembrane protein [Ralstonia solanacearum SD54]MCK4150464.1 phage tail protein [Ralstonia pseudosolanacearum]QKL90953.1 phage tail protein [Ralstonia solanacearum]QKL96030.1 phage tail protein [Ralstonia solanacearum]